MTPQIARPTSEERLRKYLELYDYGTTDPDLIIANGPHDNASFPKSDVRALLDRLDQLRERCGWCNGTGTGRVTVKAGLLSIHGGDEPTAISGPCRECNATGRRLDSDTPATERPELDTAKEERHG